jgi:type II secretory pathway pseudopilin PulG
MQHKNPIQAKIPLNGAIEAGPFPINWQRRQRDRGAMLLAVLFMMAMMVIVAMAMAPSFVQQMKRDREEEMIHRGTEYARAVKKFYKKFGRYPSNLEQLDNTNQIRFLRRRFKDPLTKDGEWKLLHYGDIQTITGGAAVGTAAALLGGQGAAQGLGSSLNQAAGALAYGQGAASGLTGATTPTQPVVLGQSDQTPSSVQTSGGASPFITQDAGTTPSGSNQGSNPAGTQNPGAANQPGSNNSIFGNSGVGGQTFGGGAIVGVASKDKDSTIRIYNKKKTYDEWMFIYNPTMDLVNVLLRGPYNGQTYGGAQVGTPAGQLNQPNQGAAGQQPGGITQPGFGQQTPQQNQPARPGGQFPPDQNQPPQ